MANSLKSNFCPSRAWTCASCSSCCTGSAARRTAAAAGRGGARRLPTAAVLIPEGLSPDGGGAGRQWFSVRGVTEENRPARVAAALPALAAYVQQAQQRFGLLQSDTALAGFRRAPSWRWSWCRRMTAWPAA